MIYIYNEKYIKKKTLMGSKMSTKLKKYIYEIVKSNIKVEYITRYIQIIAIYIYIY